MSYPIKRIGFRYTKNNIYLDRYSFRHLIIIDILDDKNNVNRLSTLFGIHLLLPLIMSDMLSHKIVSF